MKPKRAISSYILIVGVMGLSIVGGVLIFQIFSAATKTQMTQQQKDAIKPIDGLINQVVIDNLVKRSPVSEAQIDAVIDTQVAQTVVETPVAAPTATASAANQ